MAKKLTPKRGEIYWVNFDPTIGAEIKKTRPALVIQNNASNRRSSMTIVAAITSQCDGKIYPFEVLLDETACGLAQKSMVLLNQIRAMDKIRLVKKIGRLDAKTMILVNRALAISLGLVEI